jgi:fermentation-respiration switch protein FrsA (DUF1100 family)
MATPKMEIDTLEVGIPAGDITLAGVLRAPHGGSGPWPGLVLTGPFTGVKEQVVGRYAAALTSAGFVSLAFDHRNFGASGGRVRQHEDSAGKLEDLRHATSYLAAHGAVDEARLGCVGICLGGGYALKHSAFDPRIRALAAVAAAFNDPRAMRDGMGAAGYRGAMASFAEVEQRQFATGEIEYIHAVSDDPAVEAAMSGAEPFEYYGTSRSTSPGWVNQVTRLSIRELLTFDAAMGADFLGGTPALIVHGRRDDFCSPAAAEAIHERLPGSKELVWLDTTNHIDLYDQAAFVDPAVDHVVRWMTEHL